MQESLNFCQNKINIYQKQQLCSDNRRHSNLLPPVHFETVTELLIATNSTEYRTEAMQSLDVNRRIPDTQEYSKKRANELVTTDIAH